MVGEPGEEGEEKEREPGKLSNTKFYAPRNAVITALH